jgi:3-oxoacyl-[acyl-carrier protein] reductase
MDSTDLSGKIAIVTGAGSGLGRAMALGLARAGAEVVAADIDEKRAQTTAAEATAGSVMPLAVDVTKGDDCARAVAAAMEAFGGLHVLVNCAGLGMVALRPDYYSNRNLFWEADPERWQRILDVNVRGPFLMARAATPHLVNQGWGRIVNVTTSYNTMLRKGNMPYGQSKAALEAATVSWAGDLEGTGVTANVLVPGGAADTAMIPPGAPYDRGKLTDPQVMVAPVCWLASGASDGVSAMRFIGRDWDPALPAAEAMKKSGAPAGWPDLAAAAARGQSYRAGEVLAQAAGER